MDESTATEYLEMWGMLDNGNLFLIQSPLESIRDSVKVSNRFLAYVGIAATAVSAVLIWFLTNENHKTDYGVKGNFRADDAFEL